MFMCCSGSHRKKVPRTGHRRKGYEAVLVLLIACLCLTGCIGLIPSPFRPHPGPGKIPQVHDIAQAFDIVCRNYRLGPDDIVSVNYQTSWTIPAGSYKLDTLDEIEIDFFL